ncbi:MAG: tetraacyldisaccharide 4'-kinase [Thermoflavifilum sp.]|uniref:tetraacyldisaccharide 4'-kinase n=1 Tax=Thermoflavifilum sp. TaxID=1968839 RepID=UPI0018A51517|nr:tetraacyldisaccharide 4'-kinase [Thermoflavifilum sp.]QOR76121.1 MAG: tetraacyldisaccharide 4'-kinase [Thermoflavifilum sp.]
MSTKGNIGKYRLPWYRWLLWPFAALYGLGIWLRNRLYDVGLLSAVQFDVPVIAIGNLSMGGTGKTPHVDWLVDMLKVHYEPVILSRGYGRKSSGYVFAGERVTVEDIGDEPMLLHLHHREVPLAVAEQRVLAIPQLLMDAAVQLPFSDQRFVVVLDDAFQHRSLKPGIHILLTTCDALFVDDYLFPVGYLRDLKSSAQRADLIIVTKCPDKLTPDEARQIEQRLKRLPHQQIFFTGLHYTQPYNFFTGETVRIDADAEILLFTGIARPQPLVDALQQHFTQIHTLFFRDHHDYALKDIFRIDQAYQQLQGKNRFLFTTEKDAVKLWPFKDEMQSRDWQLLVQPVKIYFLFDQQKACMDYILQYLSRASAGFFN